MQTKMIVRAALVLVTAVMLGGAVHADEKREGWRAAEAAPQRAWHDPQEFERRQDHDDRGRGHDGYREVRWRGERWYFDGRAWYRPRAGGWIIATPPPGFTVSFLPDAYATLWVGGVPYYVSDDVYYRWRPTTRDYVVVAPPSGLPTPPPTASSADVYAYPMNGQDDATQDRDRYECHRWAVERSGFDPTEPNGGVSPADAPTRRSAYARADSACLSARGYSVR
jgi:hypothetical protein